MKPPKTLSDADLTEYSERHLAYEVDMLLWTSAMMYAMIPIKVKGSLREATGNALLEAFALHVRNLIDFLYLRSSGRDRPNDIVIEDYIDPSILAKHLPPISPLLSEANTKADKQVAHLAMERLAYERSGKQWRFVEIARELLDALNKVSGYFPSSRTSSRFRQLISRSPVPVPDILAKTIPEGIDPALGILFELRVAHPGSA